MKLTPHSALLGGLIRGSSAASSVLFPMEMGGEALKLLV